MVPPFTCFDTMRNFPKKMFLNKGLFLFPVAEKDFRVLSSMKGTLGVSRNCFLSFLGVGKNFRLFIQSCRFFSPDLFMEISHFSKTVHTIFIQFCTVILHPKAPACAKASKSFDWNVRNIAKISLKMAKKQHFFDFFQFPKNYPYDSNEIFYSHSTPY